MAERGLIVKIAADPRRARRLRVQVDPGHTLSVHEAAAKALDLAEGQEARWEDLQTKAQCAEARAAYQAALTLLKYRDRTRWELAQRLRTKGFAQQSVAAALNRLEEQNYVDDLRFARRFVEGRRRGRPRGRRALAWELKRKGVDQQAIEAVLDELLCGEAELNMAIELLRSRLSRMEQVDERAKRRLYSLLGRRGFDQETIQAALGRVLPEAVD